MFGIRIEKNRESLNKSYNMMERKTFRNLEIDRLMIDGMISAIDYFI